MWPLKKCGNNTKKRMLFEDVAVVVVDSSLDMSVHCFEDRILIRLIHDECKSLIPDIIASSIRECLTRALQNISCLYHQFNFEDETSSEYKLPLGFTVMPCCSSADRPCEVPSDFGPTTEKEWACPNHNIKHTVRRLWAWFASDKQEDDCSQGRCPVLDKTFLCQFPTDLHLRKLSLQLSINEMRELFIELGQDTVQWENLNTGNKKAENVIFQSLITWRNSSVTGSFNEIKSALERANITVHRLCRVLRQRLTDFDKADPYLDRMVTDEDIDKLSPLVGADSLHFLVELGLEITDWEQIEYNCGLDLVKINRTILKTWRAYCEKTERKPCLRNIYQAFTNIEKSQAIVDRYLKRQKRQ